MPRTASPSSHRRSSDTGDEATDEFLREAVALVRRVNRKLREQTPTAPQPVVADEYEPHDMKPRSSVRSPSLS
jgi:hypothetical protein